MKKDKTIACDVLVVGAGVSGVAAAVAASRAGARTVLIEKNLLPGGIAVDCSHRYLCGLYPQNHGLTLELILQLQHLSPQNGFSALGKLPVFHFRPQDLKTALRKISAVKNLNIFYNTRLTRIIKTQKTINTVQANHGKLNFKPKVVIDASGTGQAIKLSGAKYRLGSLKSRPLAGFTFDTTGLKDSSGLLPIKIPYLLRGAVDQNKLPAYFRFANFYYGQNRSSGTIKLNLLPSNNLRGKKVTKKYASLIHNYLRKNLPEFKHSKITTVSSEVHEREGIRLHGKYTLNEKDILNAKSSGKLAARGYWPIEFWDQKQGQMITYLKPGKAYGIALDCLRSINVSNLLATGKCISATSRALASSRVTGTCIYLGESAGKLAAKSL